MFLCECWIRSHTVLNLELFNDEYECKCFPRSKGKGGGLIILYKTFLSKNIAIEKYIADSVVWLKIENLFAPSMYICFSYIPHENNVYYNVYDTDIFECISNDISYFSEKGTVIIAGDLNSRVGNLLDYIEHDSIAEPLLDVLSHVLTYDGDVIFPKRVTEDTIVNSFGRKLINLCKNTGMRICNGRVEGNESGCLTFYNHLGSSVIDYVLVHKDSSNSISHMCVCDFNEWSDHAPIDFTVNCLLFDKNQRTDNNVSHTSFRWVANNLEQMKCELNEKISDFHKNIDKIQAAEMTVNEGLEYITSNLNTSLNLIVVRPLMFQIEKLKRNLFITNHGLTTNVKVYIPLTEIVYLSLVKIDVCPTG